MDAARVSAGAGLWPRSSAASLSLRRTWGLPLLLRRLSMAAQSLLWRLLLQRAGAGGAAAGSSTWLSRLRTSLRLLSKLLMLLLRCWCASSSSSVTCKSRSSQFAGWCHRRVATSATIPHATCCHNTTRHIQP